MVLLLPRAMLMEGEPSRIDFIGALSLGYVGPVAPAFAYWANVETRSHFRASTLAEAWRPAHHPRHHAECLACSCSDGEKDPQAMHGLSNR